jgi:hypothetical protein
MWPRQQKSKTRVSHVPPLLQKTGMLESGEKTGAKHE